jgi:DNA-binding NarL/FixJ family response regulator
VLVLENEDTIRSALSSRLADLGFVAQTGAVDEDGQRKQREGNFDVVVVAVDHFTESHLDFLDDIRGRAASPEVLFLANQTAVAHAVSAMKKGVFDFLERPCRVREVEGSIRQAVFQRQRREKPKLVLAMEQLATDSNLTRREHDIVHSLLRGRSNRDIASVLDITEHTVKTHLKNIFTKLQVKSRTEILSRVFTLLEAED